MNEEYDKLAKFVHAFHELRPQARSFSWYQLADFIGYRVISYRVTEPHGHIVCAITLADETHKYYFELEEVN
jgi:hypothetical protein